VAVAECDLCQGSSGQVMQRWKDCLTHLLLSYDKFSLRKQETTALMAMADGWLWRIVHLQLQRFLATTAWTPVFALRFLCRPLLQRRRWRVSGRYHTKGARSGTMERDQGAEG
jgi:hypothetical protein